MGEDGEGGEVEEVGEVGEVGKDGEGRRRRCDEPGRLRLDRNGGNFERYETMNRQGKRRAGLLERRRDFE